MGAFFYLGATGVQKVGNSRLSGLIGEKGGVPPRYGAGQGKWWEAGKV
jgi:hypothetical protein